MGKSTNTSGTPRIHRPVASESPASLDAIDVALMASPSVDGVTQNSGKIRVFLVDDHPILLYGLAATLQWEDDIEVVGEAATSREAIEKILELCPDVVVTDLELQDPPGIDGIRTMLERCPDVSVLVLTGHRREDWFFQAMQAGASGYLLKGTPIKEILEAIRAVHAGQIYVHSAMAVDIVQHYLKQQHAGPDADPYMNLTSREKEILPLIAEGQKNHDVAALLHVSPYTVQTYRQRIMQKLDLHSSTDLMKYALNRGVIEVNLNPP